MCNWYVRLHICRTMQTHWGVWIDLGTALHWLGGCYSQAAVVAHDEAKSDTYLRELVSFIEPFDHNPVLPTNEISSLAARHLRAHHG